MKDRYPIFNQHKDLVYLDTAATSQTPDSVINALQNFSETAVGSPHRGLHQMSIKATEAYLASKLKVARFLNVPASHEVIYVKSTTEGMNLLSFSLRELVQREHNIVIPITSHHANILPWQRLAEGSGMELRYVEGDETPTYQHAYWEEAVDQNTDIVSVPWVTNGLGIDYCVHHIVDLAKANKAISIIDGAQIVAHQQIDLTDLDPDFFLFSGHKMYGPQGIGVVIGRRQLLEKMSPYQVGGDMIEFVTKKTATFAEIPKKFEAGTQNVLGAVGLGAAIDFLESIGMDKVSQHEVVILKYAFERFKAHPHITVYGPDSLSRRKGLIVFNINGVHPHDVASLLDDVNIAIRAGHHCCQPLNTYLQVPATCRISFGLYNYKADIDALMDGIAQVLEVFQIE